MKPPLPDYIETDPARRLLRPVITPTPVQQAIEQAYLDGRADGFLGLAYFLRECRTQKSLWHRIHALAYVLGRGHESTEDAAARSKISERHFYREIESIRKFWGNAGMSVKIGGITKENHSKPLKPT